MSDKKLYVGFTYDYLTEEKQNDLLQIINNLKINNDNIDNDRTLYLKIYENEMRLIIHILSLFDYGNWFYIEYEQDGLIYHLTRAD